MKLEQYMRKRAASMGGEPAQQPNLSPSGTISDPFGQDRWAPQHAILL